MQAEMVDSYHSGSSAISLSIQPWDSGLELCSKGDTANLRTKILDFRGFDSSGDLKGWNSQARREFNPRKA